MLTLSDIKDRLFELRSEVVKMPRTDTQTSGLIFTKSDKLAEELNKLAKALNDLDIDQKRLMTYHKCYELLNKLRAINFGISNNYSSLYQLNKRFSLSS